MLIRHFHAPGQKRELWAILSRQNHVGLPDCSRQFFQGNTDFHFVAREAPKLFSKKNRSTRASCEHINTVTVRNGGIERTVCESCGNVSFRGLEGLSGIASRDQFERDVERSESAAS